MSVFGDVVGHQRVLDLLGRETKRPAHTYLFVGPAGVGKATVARRFAATLLCPEGGGHPGSDCAHCRRVVAGLHPDLVPVEPDARTVLSVDQARATIARATLAPVEADRKLFLFEEAGAMSEQAANALLKTLEEPTTSTIFLLVAESEDELPATVASRARTIRFGRVGEEEVARSLVSLGVGEDQARHAARISGGRPGLAMDWATRPEVAAYRSAWLAVPLRLSPRPGEAIRLADEVLAAADPLLEAVDERLEAEREALEAQAGDAGVPGIEERHRRERRRASRALLVTGLEMLASWYRDAAAAQYGAPVRNRDVPSTALTTVSPPAAVACAERALEAVEALQAHRRPQLVLAALFTELGAPD